MKHVWVASVLAVLSLHAGAREEADVRRNRGGSINYAPAPAVYTVADIDAYRRIVRLRTQDGSTVTVVVPDGVYDLGELKRGDRIQVDFRAPDDGVDDRRLAAATIWPLR